MKTLSIIIAAALVSGSGYAQQAGSLEWLQQRRIEADLAAQREQLEEIQAAQRRIRSDQETFQYEQRHREHYLRHYLEDCE